MIPPRKITGAGRSRVRPRDPSSDDPADPVLQALRTAAGFISGEVMAARLGLSRMAVWKRIRRLEGQGYVIEGAPRRGYRLLEAPDKLLPQEILHGLQTRRLRGPVHYFEVLPSTNDRAKELAAAQAPEGTLVVAEGQSAGRGRLGRQWDSPPGVGLYVSLVLRPPLPPHELPQITLTTAVAVARALKRAVGVTPEIKWPNDLLLGGKKVGGILVEMETESDQIRHLVVGLGLNVNNREFPAEIAATATSLALALKRSLARLPLLRAWLEEFEGLYQRFLDREFPAILKEWKRYAVTLGKQVAVRQGSAVVRGLAREVDRDGALLIETAPGVVVRVTSGEIASDS